MRAMFARVNEKAAARKAAVVEAEMVEAAEVQEALEGAYERAERYNDWLYFGGAYEGVVDLGGGRMALASENRERAA